MKDSLECYKTLGIEPGATPERVRNAYLQLCRFYDPSRYAEGDLEQAAKAKLKRKEVEEAYQEISHFLPGLQHGKESPDSEASQNRDFNEMVDTGPSEIPKTIVAAILATAVALILGWGYSIYHKTLELPAAAVPAANPEDSSTNVTASTTAADSHGVE